MLTWMCERSMDILNRVEVAKDGKTAYERCQGKRAKVLGFEFGEKLLWWTRPWAGHQERLSARWGHGLFLGIRRASGELIVADEKTRRSSTFARSGGYHRSNGGGLRTSSGCMRCRGTQALTAPRPTERYRSSNEGTAR